VTEQTTERQGDEMSSGALQRTVEALRARLSSVRVQTSVSDSGTALSIRFYGDEENLGVRQILTNSIAHFLPPTLFIIGIKPEQKQDCQAKPVVKI
jgi:hypothetical protein